MWYNTKNKPVQDKMFISMINKRANKMCVIKDNTNFNTELYLDVCKIKKYLTSKKLQLVQNAYVLNNLVETLKSKGMLPAICFVFSRRDG